MKKQASVVSTVRKEKTRDKTPGKIQNLEVEAGIEIKVKKEEQRGSTCTRM